VTHRSSHPIARLFTDIKPHELKAVTLAFALNFILLASYYILRPVRDAMATVFGTGNLQYLYVGTLLFTLICSPIFAWLTDTFKLSRVLPGVFWFWIANILLFFTLFTTMPNNRWVAAGYYWWFSVVNLFMISVFWSLMVDLFSPRQATRLFPVITAGGSTGAIVGPTLTTLFVNAVGITGMLLIAACGFVLVVALVHLLMREKAHMQQDHEEVQTSTLDHKLGGALWDGFRTVFSSRYAMNQALFMLMMTWMATIAYFIQTDLVAKTYVDIADRTKALADIDLLVNISSAVILLFGLSRYITRFGVTSALIINPVLNALSFIAMTLSPTLVMLQAMQAVRRVSQYAIARPAREICFTVVPQETRYKAKNVIDTVVYRLGDLSAAWAQTGLRVLGVGSAGILALALLVAGLWSMVSMSLGRRYEHLRGVSEAAAPKQH
jgi:ATP:ADP antiporter, AAA family